jgi:hypothetical protein
MLLLVGMLFSTTLAFAQGGSKSDSNIDAEIENELNQSEGPAREKRSDMRAEMESERRTQRRVLEQHREREVPVGENVNRYPKEEPLFVKPPGPVQGGSVEVPHPNAAKGLIRINKDGSYQYGLRVKEGKQAMSVRASLMGPPKISSPNGITYNEMYGSGNLVGAAFDYEWRPLRRYGTFGLQVGTGFWAAQGQGYFKNPGHTGRPQDKFNLFMIPLNLFAIYRFDYSHKQWLVPYLKGGGTLYGLAELNEDYTHNNFGRSEAFGGGGGLMLSLGRLSPSRGYTLAREYNIADLWITLEARGMVSPEKNIDFTSEVIELGLTVDY